MVFQKRKSQEPQKNARNPPLDFHGFGRKRSEDVLLSAAHAIT